MEDLLREEEFLPKQKAFNPWRRFTLFFCLAILQVLLSYFIGTKLKDGSGGRTFIALVEIIAPFILFYFMFFYKWKYHSTVMTNVIALFLLMLSYAFTIVILNTINPADRIITEDEYINKTIHMATSYFVKLLICCAIIIPVTVKRNEFKNNI